VTLTYPLQFVYQAIVGYGCGVHGGHVLLAANELATVLLLQGRIFAGVDGFWHLWLFLHDDGHGIIACALLVHVLSGSDHPRRCGIIGCWCGDWINPGAPVHPWRRCIVHPQRSGVGENGLQCLKVPMHG